MTIVAVSCACCHAEDEAIEMRNRHGALLYGFLPVGWIAMRRPHGMEHLCGRCIDLVADAFDERRPAVEARFRRHGLGALPEIAAIVGVPLDHARRWGAEWETQQERTAA